MRPPTLVRLASVCLVLTALAACGAPQRKTMQDRSEGFSDDNVLSVAIEKSPSGGADFNFCLEPPPEAAMNLTNAAWLAYLASNEYAHLHYLAQALDSHGFKTPDGSGFDWPECAIDLRLLRGFEKKHDKALASANHRGPDKMLEYLQKYAAPDAKEPWGACARRWFTQSGYDGSTYPAPSFEKYLIQTPHAGHYLQFFSGGEFVLEGKAFTEGSTQVFFARHQTKPLLIISFRGTEPDQWRDVAADGKAWKTKLSKHGWPAEWGSVHSGFRSAFDSVSDVLREKLSEYEGTEVGIWITGHSLGGALATMMGADILRRIEGGERFNLRGIYTFGSPRVGNNAFHDHFTSAAAAAKTRVVRFRNGDDTVTAIPGLLLEYKHVGTLAHLGEGTLAFPDSDPDYSGIGSVGDHSMSGYNGEKAVSGYYRRIHGLLETNPAGSAINGCASH